MRKKKQSPGCLASVFIGIFTIFKWIFIAAMAVAFSPFLIIYWAMKKDKARKAPPPTSYSPGKSYSTNDLGQQYEIACARRLKRQGYRNVKLTPVTGDFGADIVANDATGRLVCFQCKCYSSNVGESAVQEVISAVHYYGASYGVVVTNADFTPKAKQLARAVGVALWPHINAQYDWIDRIEEIDILTE